MATNGFLSTWVLPIALLAGSTAAIAREPEAIEISDEHDGQVYRVPVGAEFEVTLRGEVGENFRWEMRDDPRFITVDPPWRQGYGNKRGDRENRVFKVRVTQAGRFPLVFEKLSTFGGWKRSLDRRVSYTIEAGTPGEAARRNLPGGGAGPIALALPPLGEKDAGKLLRVPAGGEITILLPFASRLEQRWEVIGSSNIGLTRRIEERPDPGRKKNIFWLDSNSGIRLRPGGRGPAEVTFGYTPPPRDGGPMRQLRYRFTVD